MWSGHHIRRMIVDKKTNAPRRTGDLLGRCARRHSSADRHRHEACRVAPFERARALPFFDCEPASSTILRTSAAVFTARRPTSKITSPVCRPLLAARLLGSISVITTPCSPAAIALAGASVSPRTVPLVGAFCSFALASEDGRGNLPNVTLIVLSCPLRMIPSLVGVPGAIAAILLPRSRDSFTAWPFTDVITSPTSIPPLAAGLSGSTSATSAPSATQ